MNVEIVTETAQFPEKVYKIGTFVAVYSCMYCYNVYLHAEQRLVSRSRAETRVMSRRGEEEVVGWSRRRGEEEGVGWSRRRGEEEEVGWSRRRGEEEEVGWSRRRGEEEGVGWRSRGRAGSG
jgi:hypothetical protein